MAFVAGLEPTFANTVSFCSINMKGRQFLLLPNCIIVILGNAPDLVWAIYMYYTEWSKIPASSKSCNTEIFEVERLKKLDFVSLN